MTPATRLLVTCGAVCTLLLSAVAHAEQMQQLGNWEVHYVLIPTTFLNKDVAASYQIDRGRDRALVNISVLDEQGNPVIAAVTGRVTNLLGQVQSLDFEEVIEGTAVYYLAEVRHTDREVLRFEVDIVPPDDLKQQLKFQQKVYWDDP
jgi:hypothetical protein